VNYNTGNLTINTTTATNVAIGRANAGVAGYVDGQIAKVLIYNSELTHAQIAQIYNAKCVALGLSQASASTETLAVTTGLSSVLRTDTGDDPNWTQRTVSLSAYASRTIRLVWHWTVGSTGPTYQYDAGLDNISIDGNSYTFESSNQSFQTTTSNTSTSAYNSASWTSVPNSTTAGRWNRDSGGTPSGSTGPPSGQNSTWYLYAETSSPANVSGYGFWLRSPSITLSGSPGNCTYYTHLNTAGNGQGTLRFYVDVIS